MLRLGSFLLSCAILGANALALAEPTRGLPASPPAAHSVHITQQSFRLDNGLTVILSPDPKLPRVALNLWYHVGPVNEPRGRSGFAHLFEHLMFEGSKHVQHDFDHLMESMGASNVNGTTHWDRTNYYETVPAEHLETALWIESDRMAFMELDPPRLEAQRAIVKNERRQSFENAPYGPSDLALLDALFPEGHPYHGAVIGSMADLNAASMRDVHDFYRTYYAPNNATLTLVGDFEPAHARRLVEKYFGPLEGRRVPVAAPATTPPLERPVVATVVEDVELARVSRAWLAPAAYSPEAAALELGTTILAQGKASRLYRKLVVETKLASDVSAWVDPNRLCSIVGVQATATSGTTPVALRAGLDAALAASAKHPPSSAELERARRMVLLDLYEQLEMLNGEDGDSGRAGLLQRFNYYKGDPGYLERWIATLNGVDAERVLGAIRSWLAESQSATVLTEPKARATSAEGDR